MHAGLYRATGGKFVNKVASLPVLLLTTYGRKTGKPYTTPVCYVRDGQDYLVAATAGGADWEPGWSLNMRERPQAKIEVGGEATDVVATFTEGEERTRLYERFKAPSESFAQYEQKTNRVIPVIRLMPTPGRAQESGA
jgi:deazaflavin-dependent oxidoreductase (nitroreductase family)